MTTAIDSNVLAALWNSDDALNRSATVALEAALKKGSLVVAAPVYAELLASPDRDEAFIEYFFGQTGILIDWDLDESIWRSAGLAYREYASRRRKHGAPAPRRILTDFLIGAHAFRNGFPLLTMDLGLFQAAFPRLVIMQL
jgi:predicted nucleic acid-binding protein